MNLTKRQAIKLHRELWDWLYHNPSKYKTDWPRWERSGGDIEKVDCYCFACEYAMLFGGSCEHCPLDWGTENCESGDAYFTKWYYARTPKTRKKYAKLIRDLPERK